MMTKARVWRCEPNQLSELEHDLYLWIDEQPRPAYPGKIVDELDQVEDRRAPAATGGPRAPVTPSDVEGALVALEWLGYTETIWRQEGRQFRLTPWGKMVAARGHLEYHWRLLKWRARIPR